MQEQFLYYFYKKTFISKILLLFCGMGMDPSRLDECRHTSTSSDQEEQSSHSPPGHH